MWSLWWVWLAIAFLLAIVEIILPSQIFIGFAIGAGAVALGLLIGVPGLAGSLPAMLLLLAIVSLISWLVIRRAMGIRKGQEKFFDQDINED